MAAKSATFKNATWLKKLAQLNADEIFKAFDTAPHGLSNEEVEKRQEQYGLNEISHEKLSSWYAQLIKAFVNPFSVVLFALGVVSFITDILINGRGEQSWKTVIVLATMIVISGVLRFWQEFRSNTAAAHLKEMVVNTASVFRRGFRRPKEIPIAELVPGDIVFLAAGDMIPADLRIVASKDLFLSQAVLTGESLPIEKFDRPRSGTNHNILNLANFCFMGTNVVSGSATAVVVLTGSNTYFGTMAKSMTGRRTLTSFDKGVAKISWMLIRFMLVMVPIVFMINGLTKGDWLEAFLFAISIGVGLTPEMLPMIVTTNLAKSAVAMAQRKTIVKRLNAIQNFGAMDILCTDKTGTLTQNKIILELSLDINGEKNMETLEYAYLNSCNQTGLKNLLDEAVMDYGDDNGLAPLQATYQKVDEIPFDFVRRKMSVVLKKSNHNPMLICKGAVQEILGSCTKALNGAQHVSLTAATRQTIVELTERLNQDGLRVLAVAYKPIPDDKTIYTVADETDLILVGFVAFLDPPKETAAGAIAALQAHGVDVKVVTGDNEAVTRKICLEVGLEVTKILNGKDIDIMTDKVLAKAAEDTTIFASMSPLQKYRVVRALQQHGHTVGFLGDGINDAAALRAADVGISVDTAVDIAKESADIILLEKNLLVLEEGVIEGRKTFGNIIKYIKMTTSSNFGNVFSVLAASAFLPFLPMLPIHLLVQNLLYDLSQISIPWDHVDEDYLAKPRKWNAAGIARFMMCIGPISSIFDICTFWVMWHVFQANTPEHQSLFQSGWFVVGLLTQTLIVHMIRTRKIPFIQSRASLPVVLSTLVIMIIGLYIPFSSLGLSIRLTPLPMSYFPWLVGILLGYSILIHVVKRWYIRRFKHWL